MKYLKTRQELINHMWKTYPNDDQLPEREGMLKAYDFLTGGYDSDEKTKQEIKQEIKDLIPNFVRNKDKKEKEVEKESGEIPYEEWDDEEFEENDRKGSKDWTKFERGDRVLHSTREIDRKHVGGWKGFGEGTIIKLSNDKKKAMVNFDKEIGTKQLLTTLGLLTII